jgi:hypothetical protein
MTPATTKLSLADLLSYDPTAPDTEKRERRFCCPLPACTGKPINAAHRSLSANKETGAWRCSRCDERGKLTEYWTDRPAQSRREKARSSTRRAFTLSALPEQSEPDLSWRAHLKGAQPIAGTPGEQYLSGRGIPASAAAAARVMYHPAFYGRPAVVFPVYGEAGQAAGTVAAQGRHLDDRTTPRVRSIGEVRAGVFATPGAWEAERLIVTEAAVDALTLAAAGYPAIALMGASNCPAWLPTRCAFRSVVLALDGDEAGDKAAAKLANDLLRMGARVERLRPNWFKDWNDLAQRLPEGLSTAIAAALGESNQASDDTSAQWDEAEAFEARAQAVRELPELLPEGSIGWAEEFRPDLLRATDAADAATEAAWEARDATGLQTALEAFRSAHTALGEAFAQRGEAQGLLLNEGGKRKWEET